MKTPTLIFTLFVSLALVNAQQEGVLDPAGDEPIPEDAVVEDPVKQPVDDTTPDNVPPPIPVTDPLAKLKLVQDQQGEVVEKDLFAYLKSQPDLSMFVQLVEKAGAQVMLSQGGPYTVFAPTDEAFQKLPESMVRGMLNAQGSALPNRILQRHIVENVIPTSDVDDASVGTAGGSDLRIRAAGDGSEATVMVGAATVTEPDIVTTNGVIHKVDTVLVANAAN